MTLYLRKNQISIFSNKFKNKISFNMEDIDMISLNISGGTGVLISWELKALTGFYYSVKSFYWQKGNDCVYRTNGNDLKVI